MHVTNEFLKKLVSCLSSKEPIAPNTVADLTYQAVFDSSNENHELADKLSSCAETIANLLVIDPDVGYLPVDEQPLTIA